MRRASSASRRSSSRTDRLKELRDLGLGTFLDPCPMDIGRDVNFMAEAASSAGIQLICATGLYRKTSATPPISTATDCRYCRRLRGRADRGNSAHRGESRSHQMRDLQGKDHRVQGEVPASRRPRASEDRRAHHHAYRRGYDGPRQLEIFASERVDLKHVIVGHSCGASDLRYHTDMLDRDATWASIASGWIFCIPTACASPR